MSKVKYFERIKKLINDKTDTDPAANAIRFSITNLIAYDLCSIDEFLSLIDPDQKKDWKLLADEIARVAIDEIMAKRLHPNVLRPWLNCHNYPVVFGQLSKRREWRQLHSALHNINKQIRSRFGS